MTTFLGTGMVLSGEVPPTWFESLVNNPDAAKTLIEQYDRARKYKKGDRHMDARDFRRMSQRQQQQAMRSAPNGESKPLP